MIEQLTNLGAVCLGGALGSALRYGLNESFLNTGEGKFPFHTFAANVLGSFLIGFLFVMADQRWELSEHIRLFIFVGVLGAFTTFSTFELEIWSLVENEKYLLSVVYLTASVVTGFVGLVLGVKIAQQFS